MALRFKDLTSQVNGVNLVFTIAPAHFAAGTTTLIKNGAILEQTVDYTEGPSLQTLTTLLAPLLGDSLWAYYDDSVIVPFPSSWQVPTLKSDYLFGLPLKDQFGNVMSDATLGNKLTIGIARIQRELKDLSLIPQVIKSTIVNGIIRNDGSYAVTPDPVAQAQADIFEDPYDYDVNDYINWGFMILRRKPVISIERVRLIYPTGQTIIQYPNEWIKIYHRFGQMSIVPMAGSFNQYPLIGQGAMYLPLLSGYLTRNIPQLIHVDYTAGLTTMPDDLRDCVYKSAAIEVLKAAGQGMAPGMAALSTGADGLTESTTLTQSANSQMFGPLIKQYTDDVAEFLRLYRATDRGTIDFRVA